MDLIKDLIFNSLSINIHLISIIYIVASVVARRDVKQMNVLIEMCLFVIIEKHRKKVYALKKFYLFERQKKSLYLIFIIFILTNVRIEK